MSYNGWSNYETWLVNLWYGDLFVDMANEDWTGGEIVEDFVMEMLADEGALPETGFAADIMNAALRNVNWRELAEHYNVNDEDESEDEDDLEDA